MPRKTNRPPTKKVSSNGKYNLLILAGFLVVVTGLVGGLATIKPKKEEPKILAEVIVKETEISSKNLPLPPLSSKSVFVEELETGKVLLAINEKDPALPASTTKIATALVAMSHYDPQIILTVGDVRQINGQKMKLFTGEKITVENLLYGLLVFSANDAAEVLSQSYPGGKANFVSAMKQLAKDLGLENTNFTNPQGYDDYLHFSSSEDLVKLAKYAMQNPTFAKMVGTKNYRVTNADATVTHNVSSTNDLLSQMPGVLGVKTGWTENSKEDLVTLYEKDSRKILMAVLGSSDRFGETKKIIEWIFENYEWRE